jgi:hypothetical protein
VDIRSDFDDDSTAIAEILSLVKLVSDGTTKDDFDGRSILSEQVCLIFLDFFVGKAPTELPSESRLPTGLPSDSCLPTRLSPIVPSESDPVSPLEAFLFLEALV